jgi:hypothetical protein
MVAMSTSRLMPFLMFDPPRQILAQMSNLNWWKTHKAATQRVLAFWHRSHPLRFFDQETDSATPSRNGRMCHSFHSEEETGKTIPQFSTFSHR